MLFQHVTNIKIEVFALFFLPHIFEVQGELYNSNTFQQD